MKKLSKEFKLPKKWTIRQNKKAFNCGVEDLNYKPINLNDVLKILQ